MESMEVLLLGLEEGEDTNFSNQRFEQFLQEQEVVALLTEWRQTLGLSSSWSEDLEPILATSLASASPATLTLAHRLGVASLQLFLAVNWLGLKLSTGSGKLLAPLLASCPDLDLLQEKVLVGDGESLVPAVREPLLLLLAKLLLLHCRAAFPHMWTGHLWSLRCCSLLAEVLEERSDCLRTLGEQLVGEGLAAKWQGEAEGARPLYLLEAARHHTRYCSCDTDHRK